MPNHIQHNMTFIGPALKVTALLNHIKGKEEENLFDFNKVIPMPAALEGTTSHSYPDYELIAKYGFSDWYGWRLHNWNTKWGSYDASFSEEGIRFQTAWSTARPVFAKLSELFPDVEIIVEYADEDMGHNCGRLTYKGGDLTSELEGDLEEACRIWEYDYDEYLADVAADS